MPDNSPPSQNNPGNPPARVTTTYTEISGPIPPPQILQHYNNIVPNAAERIISMAEKQSDHRMSLERKVIDSNIMKSYLGMIVGVSIALYGLYIAKEIAVNGNPATAGIIAVLDIGGLVWIAVNNTRAQKKQREKRQESASAPPIVH